MKEQRGFTLVELLVVVTIIGILIAIAVPNYTKIKNKARDTQVRAGITTIINALANYQQNHDGLYPGTALPMVGTGGGAAFYVEDAAHGLPYFGMRGIIGGGLVRPEDPTLYFLDAFYFQPKTDGSAPPQLPDRLVADGSIDSYPTNPFRLNIQGVTDAGVPMMNIFGLEFVWAGSDRRNNTELTLQDLNLDYTNLYGEFGPGNYSFPDRAEDLFWEEGLDPNVAVPSNANNLRWDRNGDNRYTVEDEQTMFTFPTGDFAYIPLDPIQTDIGADDFMRFCKNYWIIGYGSTDTAKVNKYANVNPNFPRPLGNGDPNSLNFYEMMVKHALCGAMIVKGTAYQDQIRVADQS